MTTKQTPNCGYQSSGWRVVAGPTISGNSEAQFLTIDSATGMYSIAPGLSRDTVG